MTWYDNMMQKVDVGVSTGSKEDAFPGQNHDVLCGFGGATVSQRWKSPMVLRAGFKSLFVRRFGGCLTDGSPESFNSNDCDSGPVTGRPGK